MKLKKKIFFALALIISCLFFVEISAQAASEVAGYTVAKRAGTTKGYNVEFYKDFNFRSVWGTITGHSGEFIVNKYGSTSSDGLPISGILGVKDITIDVGTWSGSGSLAIRIKGILGTTTATGRWIVVGTDSVFTGTGTSQVTISPFLDRIQILQSVSDTGAGTQSVTILGILLGETENL